MAYSIGDSRNVNFTPGEDLSAAQFLFVKMATDGTVRACDKRTAPVGILLNQPSAGATGAAGSYVAGQYSATVAVDGVTRLAVDNAYNPGTLLVSTDTGYGSSVTNASTSWLYGRAIALQSSATGGDIIAVRMIGPVGATGMNG